MHQPGERLGSVWWQRTGTSALGLLQRLPDPADIVAHGVAAPSQAEGRRPATFVGYCQTVPHCRRYPDRAESLRTSRTVDVHAAVSELDHIERLTVDHKSDRASLLGRS